MLSDIMCQTQMQSWNFILGTRLTSRIVLLQDPCQHFGDIAFHCTCQLVKHVKLSIAGAKEKVLKMCQKLY